MGIKVLVTSYDLIFFNQYSVACPSFGFAMKSILFLLVQALVSNFVLKYLQYPLLFTQALLECLH